MQQAGHITHAGRIILVLARLTRRGDAFFVSLKMRSTGGLGKELTDESLFLADNPDLLKALLKGDVIKC